MGKTTTILFDCDNTLVLSEEIAFEVCAELSNEILEKNGKTERYTGESLLREFVGQNFRGMLKGLAVKHDFTIEDEELDRYVASELGHVVAGLKARAKPCVGVDAQLEKLKQDGKYQLAVVSSSALSRVQASIEKVDQAKYFRPDWVYSAATSLPVPTSKPDPAVYLYAMEQIGVKPEECVAVEDSKSGATAATRAKIPTIGYVGPYPADEQEHMIKVLKEVGVAEIMTHWDQFPEILKKIDERA